jgi:phosphopantetheine adenylyltransferase
MDWSKPTTQLLGRFQPWHEGHQALFERAYAKTGQVIVMVRDTNEYMTTKEVIDNIYENLKNEYDTETFEVLGVPNIVNITYGRDVGYAIEQERLDAEIESVSATAIRNAKS